MQLIKACLLDMRHSYINLRKNSGEKNINVLHIISNDENIKVFDTWNTFIYWDYLNWKFIHAKNEWYLIKLGLYFFNARFLKSDSLKSTLIFIVIARLIIFISKIKNNISKIISPSRLTFFVWKSEELGFKLVWPNRLFSQFSWKFPIW